MSYAMEAAGRVKRPAPRLGGAARRTALAALLRGLRAALAVDRDAIDRVPGYLRGRGPLARRAWRRHGAYLAACRARRR